MPLTLTAKQEEAQHVLASDATHIMLFGGSRSGKTLLLMRNIILRALKAPGSRHAVMRFRFNHVKASVVMDTFPKCMELAFPGVPYHIDKTDWYASLGEDSRIWFCGLDDKERAERVLGQEYVTLFLNECSQIPQSSRDIAATRLAQQVTQKIINRSDNTLRPRIYYDANPPSKAHWTYRMFMQKVDPETRLPFPNPGNYASFQMNPRDNAVNLPADYITELQGLPARLRKRFLAGEFADATPNQLFFDETIEKWRVLDGAAPDFIRIVVAVDPSGSGDVDNADNDAIGIIVAALGTDGNAYVLEDCTVKVGPATWGKIATDAFERHAADVVVGEVNYGGEMVRHTIQTARARTPYKAVHATRGKAVRAEPIAALYEQGKVRHVGYFRELEDELSGFSTVGYTGERSPNRADACLIGDALVRTQSGDVPIRDVRPGQAVLTRRGWKRVLDARMTRQSAPTLCVEFSDGRSIRATAEHPVFVAGRGFVRVDALVCGDMIEPVENWEESCHADTRERSSWTERLTRAIPRATGVHRAFTTLATTISTIASYGRSTTARFLRAGTSIIATMIRSITLSRTLNLCDQQTIPGCTSDLIAQTSRGLISTRFDTWPRSGTRALPALPGTRSSARSHGAGSLHGPTESVRHAGRSSSAAAPGGQPATAAKPAIGPLRMLSALTRSVANVRAAEATFGRTSIASCRQLAPVYVVSVCGAGSAPVFNLEVEDAHEFFANGVLVHNCIWGLTELFPGVVAGKREKKEPTNRSAYAGAWQG